MRLQGTRFLLASAGSGGHIIPAISIAGKLAEKGAVPLMVTGKRYIEDRILEGTGIERRKLTVEGGRFGLPFHLLKSFLDARGLMKARKVGAVISTGGRIGIPVAMAAMTLGIPFFLVETNVVPGRASRFLSRFARRIYLGFPQAIPGFFPEGKTHVSGLPIRDCFFSGVPRKEALARFGFGGEECAVFFIFGGSMGAESLNSIVLDTLARPGFLPEDVKVIHATGRGMFRKAKDSWAKAGVDARVFEYLHEIHIAYFASSLAISRGGAMTVGELLASRLPSIIVPYPWHRDKHQEANANILQAIGGAIVISQDEAREKLAPCVASLLGNRKGLIEMKKALESVEAKDGAREIVIDIEKIVCPVIKRP